MSNKWPVKGSWRTVGVIVLLAFCIALVLAACQALSVAHAKGLGTTEAMHDLLKHWIIVVGYTIVMSGFMLGVAFFSYRHLNVPRNEALEVGAKRHTRTRLINTLAALLICAVAAVHVGHRLATGLPLGQDEWAWVGMATVLVAINAWQWIEKPSPERLYAIATGDASRLNDERTLQVKGRAAVFTGAVFTLALLIGGTAYESILRGEWPIRTLVELALLFVLQAIGTWYWNRKL
jgi:hypothetical protein